MIQMMKKKKKQQKRMLVVNEPWVAVTTSLRMLGVAASSGRSMRWDRSL